MLRTLLRNFRWHRTADRWGPRRLIVADLSPDSTRTVVVARDGDTITWESGQILPRMADDFTIGGKPLGQQLRTAGNDSQYVSVVYGLPGSFVRLLNFPGQPPRAEILTSQVRQTLGVDDTYEARHHVVRQAGSGEKNPEFAVLATALPVAAVDSISASLHQSNLSTVSLVTRGTVAANLAERDLPDDGRAVGFLEIGNETSMLLLYVGENLALARQFKVGLDMIVESLMKAFDLDYDTAAKLFNSGSFDFSGNITSSVSTWMHQVSISLDFIERRYGGRVDDLYLFGAGTGTQVLISIFRGAVHRNVKPWAVVEGLATGSPPAELAAPPGMFALALGEAQRVMTRGIEHGA